MIVAARFPVHQLSGYAADGLIACPACDGVHRISTVPARGKALCQRCGALLYRPMPHSLDHTTALYVTALILLVIANSFPFVALQYGDRIEQSRLASAGLALLQAGMAEVGVLVLLTSVVFPTLTILAMLALLLPLRMGWPVRGQVLLWRLLQVLLPWSLVGVFMLGLLVSVVKLQDLAVVVPGVAFFAFIGLLVVSSAAWASFDAAVLWPRVGPLPGGALLAAVTPVAADTAVSKIRSAAALGYASCQTCGLLVASAAAPSAAPCSCPRCASTVTSRRANSLAQSAALLITAAILLVPANLYPVMTVSRFGQGEPSTILAGVMQLIQDGTWPLGLLVLFASFVVPLGKIAVLAFLNVSVRHGSTWRQRDRTVLYRITDVVGAWSMVDVFLVAILVALVRMEGMATVAPGMGASFFGAAVIATLLAAHVFDSRLIWDAAAGAQAVARAPGISRTAASAAPAAAAGVAA